jgi:hypothetical protein
MREGTEITSNKINDEAFIKNGNFADCMKLKSVTIPRGVESIGESAFRSCISLTEVIMNVGLKAIGNNAFKSCCKLESVAESCILYLPHGSKLNYREFGLWVCFFGERTVEE